MASQLLSVLAANPAGERGSASKIAYHAPTNQLLYPRGRSLVLRSLGAPPAATGAIKFAVPGTSTYVEHAQPITAVSVSPTGFYAATGDSSGTVRVWDLIAGDKVLKLEHKALTGPVRDIAWDAESKRLLAVGDGREKFGSAFLLDSGSSVGTIEGHSKPINAVALNRQRPYRALTVSDDSQLGWYTGVPYKLAQTSRPLSKFVHAADFSPGGTYAAAAGSDGYIVLLNGKDGTSAGKLEQGEGTIYSLAFAPDKEQILASAGADGKVKIYELVPGDKVEGKLLAAVDLASGSTQGGDQLVALAFTSPTSLVVESVRGVLTEVNFASGFGSKAELTPLLGPTKGVTDLAVLGSVDGQDLRLSAASYDGRVYTYDLGHSLDFSQGGAPSCVALAFDKGASGTASAAVVALASTPEGKLIGATLDDKLQSFTPGQEMPKGEKVNPLLLAEGKSDELHGQPRNHGIALDGKGGVYVATTSGLDVFSFSGAQQQISIEGAMAVAAHATAKGTIVAVGLDSSEINLYLVSGTVTKLAPLSANRSAVTTVAFSPDGTLLAVGESSGKIIVYDTSSLLTGAGSESVGPKIVHWVFHTARVESIAWSPDSKFAVSGSLDTHVYVWSVTKPMKHLAIKDAHAGGVTSTVFLDPQHIASAGADGLTNIYRLATLPGQ